MTDLQAKCHDLQAHSKHDRALLKSLAEDNERLRREIKTLRAELQECQARAAINAQGGAE